MYAEGLFMNPQRKNKSPLPLTNPPTSLLPEVPAAAKASVTSTTSDCLYQFAALTVGAFMLATLL
jgi:hypothetical protein